MLLRPGAALPPGAGWAYELKLDGFRAVAIKSGGRVQLRSRNNRDFNRKYPSLVQALSTMPDETVIDGEVVALDSGGRPWFSALPNYNAKSEVPLVYYVFDVMIPKPRRKNLWVTDSFENRGRSDRADAKDDAE
jgi:bifunctional non-homologous end joining protein LigD